MGQRTELISLRGVTETRGHAVPVCVAGDMACRVVGFAGHVIGARGVVLDALQPPDGVVIPLAGGPDALPLCFLSTRIDERIPFQKLTGQDRNEGAPRVGVTRGVFEHDEGIEAHLRTRTPSFSHFQLLSASAATRLQASAGQLRFPFSAGDSPTRKFDEWGTLPRFWQPRFYDFNVWSAKKRKEKLEYMHRNPVTRGLVEHPRDWPWSSWSFYAGEENGLVPIHPVE